jgi:hypothetical protein
MNYLTAIIAVPLFLAIWIFELFLMVRYGGRIKKSNMPVVRVCLAVSTLQMISCWFWLFGFVYSKKKDSDGDWKVGVGVLSEAMEDDEEMNCVGLVGAEVLLAVFQALFSLVTVYQALEIRAIFMRTQKVNYRKSEWTLTLVAFALGIYVYFSWITAHNRRCQKSGHPKWAENAKLSDPNDAPHMLKDLGMGYNGSDTEFESIYIPWQHHFYPIFLIFDSIFGLMLYSDVKKLASSFQSSAGKGQVNQTVRTFQKFFKFEAQMILIGCVLAILIFIIQFMLKVKALSIVACFFCVAMYVTYACRRVPMMMLYTQFPPFVKKFGMDLGDQATAVKVVPDSNSAPVTVQKTG